MSGAKLRLLTEDDYHDAVVDLLSEIKLITGAVVYDGDMLQMQLEMIKRFLITGFSMLTKAEIVEAFYLNAAGAFEDIVVHYNKELNAEYIGKVLKAYLKMKARLREEKHDKILGLLARPKQIVKRSTDWEFWKEAVQRDLDFLNGRAPEIKFWHDRKYHVLRRYGLCPFKSLNSWLYFMRRALVTTRYDLNLPAGCNLSAYRLVTINQVSMLFRTSEEYKRCVADARRIAYWYVLNALAEVGINHIWEDVAWKEFRWPLKHAK